MQSAFVAIASGRVQMVLYRDFCQRKARALRIAGEVENLVDGTVRVRAEGPREGLEKFAESLKRGSLLSRVDHVALEWVKPTGEFTSFIIRYT